MNIWDIFAYFFWTFVFISYLMVLFSVIGDVMRDRSLNGWAKAAWMLFLIFVPFLTALIYLIARGGGMGERQGEAVREAQTETDKYIRDVAGASSSPADDIAKAKALLDAGTINQSEFDGLKSQALSARPTPVAV
ncbi:PLDc_N domain-containing protein [Cryobacterium adonitolivorans]|uniref:PLDc_N domain-containing protein n=1 Tax=Cryobacterium adonitolivorans TaxID=1259189 RepID=A0A4V3IDH7_9MICO|nr:PLD nuclease N-terminal domain-containing protein [Cryobacterium adonitolivorans]TFC06900.1 PLDc_N domain-containing protein [Cryobacterium adonitolivorans]